MDQAVLRKKRGYIKSKFTSLEKQILKLDDLSTNHLSLLKNSLTNIEKYFDEFQEVHSQIECSEDNNEFDDFFSRYMDTHHTISSYINSLDSKNKSVSCKSYPLKSVKLPEVSLPKFNGKFDNWLEFYDSFCTMVHNNDELSNIQKFIYLKTSLEGEAELLVRGLQTTEDNYIVAFNNICDRYNNPREIINSHVNSILNLKPISKELFSFRSFIDTLNNSIGCLKCLKQPVDQWDALLIPIITNKLDDITRQEWEFYLNSNKFENLPKYKDIIDFLQIKRKTVESRKETGNNLNNKKSNDNIPSKSTNRFTVITKCHKCKGDHPLNNCQSYLQLDFNTRKNFVKSSKLCFNCLKRGHSIESCRSSHCQICKQKHHTSLHVDRVLPENSQTSVANQHKNSSNSSSVVSQVHNTCNTCVPEGANKNTHVLLSTAIVNGHNPYNSEKTLTLRVLLDSGAQANYITEKACRLLNLPASKTNTTILGINGSSSKINKQTNLRISSLSCKFNTSIECLVIPKITENLPGIFIAKTDLSIPTNIKLADETFNKPGEIDLLIGATLFYKLLNIGQKHNDDLTFQKTKLGWIISGSCPINKNSDATSIHLSLNQINDNLKNFWKIDEFVNSQSQLKPEELYCEEYFKNTTSRNPEGRFIVRIPVKQNISNLGNSYNLALKRFYSLENKFIKNNHLKKGYTNCMSDYIIQNHMTECNMFEENEFYLPHHAVFKNSSTTTKLRVVFDGSCKPNNGLAINEIQYSGPILQNDLFCIITRFRTHQFVFTADISQMYRQILIHEEDRKFQKILWRESPNHPVKQYKLNRVTFGMTSAPYLAIRCLLELGNINKKQFPLESEIIKSDFYVDDVLTGSNNIKELENIKNNLILILKQGGFDLRKFISNVSHLCDNENDCQNLLLNENISKILGISWCHKTDKIVYCVKNSIIFEESNVTKRTILSSTAQLFDPIGLLAPIFVLPKIIMQRLWLLKLSWDEPVPTDIYTSWTNFKNELHHINEINVNRCIIIPNCIRTEIHGFSDASQKAYGACIYLKTFNNLNESTTHLLAAKSRVVPVKPITLPRLELLGAVLLADLMKKFKNILKIKIDREFCWTDSSIVLYWIQSDPLRFSTFVANRISFLQTNSDPKQWRHVSSNDNPSDLISRGCSPSLLKNSNLWWYGPNWLNKSEKHWPINKFEVSTKSLSDNSELKGKSEVIMSAATCVFPIANYSSLTKLKNVIAYILRFKNNCLNQSNKLGNTKKNTQTQFLAKIDYTKIDPLSSIELINAMNVLVKISQSLYFSNEIKNLMSNQPLSSKSSILSLNPFVDELGILRVGGRLNNSSFSYTKKHPILLSDKDHFTKLIFEQAHKSLLHASVNTLLSHVRETFWPISGRNLAKKIVRNCILCFKFKPRNEIPIMGDLPRDRVSITPPFTNVGVDYAGPILIKDKKGRGNKSTKCYIALFICFSTRAIHLELVSTLTTDAFLSCFNRFISRRGRPQNVYSDNGSNFQGANNEIRQLYDYLKVHDTEITAKIHSKEINWKFIPANSPHMGGLWEAGVKSAKYHLLKVMQSTSLIFEDLTTILYQIEAILNSRPLTPLSSDPNDLEPLTPAHFLIGRTFTAIPYQDVTNIKLNRLDQFQQLKQINQHFWKRWTKEYISNLQQRLKWNKISKNIKLNTMVLIKDDHLAPYNWKIGRVIQLHPGEMELRELFQSKRAREYLNELSQEFVHFQSMKN